MHTRTLTCSISIHIHVHHIYNTCTTNTPKLRTYFSIDTYQNDEINEVYCKPITYTAKKDIKNASIPTKHTKKPTIFVTFYVKIFPILLKTTKNTHSKRKKRKKRKISKKISKISKKNSHTGKIWGKKNFQKKIYQERHTRSEASTRGGMALIYRQLRTFIYHDSQRL